MFCNKKKLFYSTSSIGSNMEWWPPSSNFNMVTTLLPLFYKQRYHNSMHYHFKKHIISYLSLLWSITANSDWRVVPFIPSLSPDSPFASWLLINIHKMVWCPLSYTLYYTVCIHSMPLQISVLYTTIDCTAESIACC